MHTKAITETLEIRELTDMDPKSSIEGTALPLAQTSIHATVQATGIKNVSQVLRSVSRRVFDTNPYIGC